MDIFPDIFWALRTTQSGGTCTGRVQFSWWVGCCCESSWHLFIPQRWHHPSLQPLLPVLWVQVRLCGRVIQPQHAILPTQLQRWAMWTHHHCVRSRKKYRSFWRNMKECEGLDSLLCYLIVSTFPRRKC